jgi:DNA-directed RNA polymerase specialized sigma24 family protein
MAHLQQDDTAHYKQYEGLINKLAGTFLPRAMGLEPTMDFDDVRGLMVDLYLKAKPKFDPTRGFKFTTYFQNAAYNEFNKWCDKKQKERRAVAACSAQDMHGADEEGENDCYDFMGEDESLGPDEVLEQKQQRKDFAKRIATMDPKMRQVVAILVQGPGPELRARFCAHQDEMRESGRHVPEDITVDFIARSLGFSQREAMELRSSLSLRFGVDFPSLNRRAWAGR